MDSRIFEHLFTCIFLCRVLLPFAIREAVNILGAGNSTNETASLGSFGFLYGTFPVAPTVLIYASQYNMALDMVRKEKVTGLAGILDWPVIAQSSYACS